MKIPKMFPMTKVIFQANIMLVGVYLVIASLPVLKSYELNLPIPVWLWISIGMLFVVWMIVNNILFLRIKNNNQAEDKQLYFNFKE